MKEVNNSCPKCSGEMQDGFTFSQDTWIEGKPEYEFWSGFKTNGRKRYAITSYCCTQCGFLEQYALNPIHKEEVD